MQISTCGALLALCSLTSVTVSAQQRPTLANSTLILKEAVGLHDQGNYAGAIAQYLAVPASDTAYVRVQHELALSYLYNKQYQEAIAAGQRALDLHVRDPQVYNIMATAYENLDNVPAALKLYTEALRLHPYNQALWYNQGVSQSTAGDIKGAVASLQRSLELAPLHANSHYSLAYLAQRQGQTSHALLGMLTYLAIQPDGERSNSVLVMAEQLASNAVEMDAKERLPATLPNGAFQELDELINSKVALRKDYASKVKFNANVVKQLQLLVEKFPAADADPNDFWLRLYSPLIKVLRQEDNLTAFTYLTLLSAGDKQAAQWVKSNKARVTKMAEVVGVALNELRVTQLVQRGGKLTPVKGWYNDEGNLVGLGDGEEDAKKATFRGPWLFLDDVGTPEEEGVFSAAGVRNGTWKSFFPDGKVRLVKNYDAEGKLHGAYLEYHDNGTLSIEGNYVHGEPEGVAKLYRYCGSVYEARPYQKGEIDGETVYLAADGKTEGRTAYRAGKKEGPATTYYPNGVLEAEYTYVADQRQGPFAVYYADKTLERKGTYDKDELHGPYTAHFPNGKLYQTGTYDHGKSVGQWRTYYRSGKLSVEQNFNAAGELHGTLRDFDATGAPTAELEYEQGRVTRVTALDKAGKTLAKVEVKKGKTPVQVLRANGKPRSTGTYLNGHPDGEWRWYYGTGALETVRHYSNGGKLNGLVEQYYTNGQVRTRQSYTNDEADGYFESFYEDGQPSQTGFWQHDQRQGLWRDYYVDGRVSEEYYYRNDEQQGPARSFTPGGKLSGERQYLDGRLLLVTALDSTGKEISRQQLTPDTKEYILRYPSGKIRYRMPMLCFEEQGSGGWLTPAGGPEATLSMQQGQREGAYRAVSYTGKTAVEGQLRQGRREGEWKTYYPSGALSSRGSYYHGEQDGEWTTFFENGKTGSVAQYLNGQRQGTLRTYNMLGELLVEKHYDEDNLVGYRAGGADGQPRGEVIPFETGNGPLKIQFANGKPAVDETYKGAYVDGPQTLYYSTGQVYRRSQVLNGVLTGKLETFYPDGKLMEEEYYAHDELQGRARYYRPNGKLEREVTYRSGERSGPTVYYDALGKPVKTDYYWNNFVYGSK
ncbi:tetratricopeptide repeat protein [Hymenobacter cellulosilyticus]|uniref:Tetratricopeptide repeat protein n=1 Tax=Hymenobacter cellulosilyticus TaxID=2932248 RepID=A0A8T9QC55_9BACT|nr:tetratricopeptide repeat protein [Hymenobacter cellulosilyticus]UOQ72433.1 tetratricopeptide repeat protein [Hymenobacter cellulosilyticus]